MLKLFAMLAAAALAAPPEGAASEFRAAIWNDLQMNALIGNGNWIGSLWYNAGRDNPAVPDLHIQDLACSPTSGGHRCDFILFRDGGVAKVFGEVAPDKLRCDAIFERQDGGDGLSVKHLPPRGGGHSRTTMRCLRARA